MGERYDVFISYSSQDQKIVEGICGYLERKGYRCFVAYRDIPRGVVWASAITEAIDASKMMVVVFSNAFNVSSQTDREIELASENQMPILTYRVSDEKMTGAKKYYLKNLNWIDAFPRPETFFGQLLDSVVKLIGPSGMEAEPATQGATEPLAMESVERRRLEREQLSKDSVKEPPVPKSKPKGKKSLWFALGAAAIVVSLLLLLWPKKKESVAVDPETETYQACQTVQDYRHYIAFYGLHAKHYSEAKGFIDNYVSDSIQRVQDSLAQVEIQQLARQQAELKIAEDEAYGKCTTLAACNRYLKTYPQGRYVVEVNAKKAELEQQAKTMTETESETPQSSLSGSANGHEYVNLGLPSGTLWATCNVGASSPKDYGDYFAWGETKTKRTYNWETYLFANGTSTDQPELTKYCSNSEVGENGFTDNLTTLQANDDPARTNWGKGWCTPSKAQWEELLENTTNNWTKQDGVKGCLFTSKKNGMTIFLPAAGCYLGDDPSRLLSYCTYWSRSLHTNSPSYAWDFFCNWSGCGMYCNCERYYGFSVRPVREK